MSLQRFQVPYPTRFKGLEDLAPAEMQEFVKELIRRFDSNWTALSVEAQGKLVADPAILPTLTDGSSPPAAFNSATTQDMEQAILMGMMLR